MTHQTYHHNRNYGCRITELNLQGYRCVVLENEKLRVTVIADKGTDIYEFLFKPKDIDFLWRTWQGLRPAAHQIATSPRAAGAFMDSYEGGWQELFPNCGGSSLHQGAEIGQHGEVCLLPWRYWITRDDPEEIEVSFEVRTVRTPFHLVKTLTLRRNEAILRIRERVTNESGQAVDFIWGHHPVFGSPFVNQHCRIDLPDCRIRTLEEYTDSTSRLAAEQESEWPRAKARDGGVIDLSRVADPESAAIDMVFLEGITDGWCAITNPELRLGFGLRYPAEVFKVLWYWQVYRGGEGYPWWKSTYSVALEPCASLPVLARAAERGEALRLEAGASREIELLAVAYEGLERVTSISPEGHTS